MGDCGRRARPWDACRLASAQGSLTLLVWSILHPHYTDVETETQCATHSIARALGLMAGPSLSLFPPHQVFSVLCSIQRKCCGLGRPRVKSEGQVFGNPSFVPHPSFCPLLGSSNCCTGHQPSHLLALSPSQFFQLAERSTSAPFPP